jgi:hypothetical protein
MLGDLLRLLEVYKPVKRYSIQSYVGKTTDRTRNSVAALFLKLGWPTIKGVVGLGGRKYQKRKRSKSNKNTEKLGRSVLISSGTRVVLELTNLRVPKRRCLFKRPCDSIADIASGIRYGETTNFGLRGPVCKLRSIFDYNATSVHQWEGGQIFVHKKWTHA